MAKTIKFNLILDSNSVRCLDDLRDNFNIDDLLGAYRNGSLKRWLESRELSNEIEGLDKISGDDITVARELCRIFHVDCAKEQLEAAAYPFMFRQKEENKLSQYQNLTEQKDEVILAYHEGYEKLLKELDEKGSDYAFVKSAVTEIYKRYAGLYQLDAEAFYGRFIQAHPLVILAMLANADMRPLIARMPEEIFGEMNIPALTYPRFNHSEIDDLLGMLKKDDSHVDVQEITNNAENLKLRKLSVQILILDCKLNPKLNGSVIYSENLESNCYPLTYIPLTDNILPPQPNHVKTCTKKTDDIFNVIEPSGKRFLIIKMEENTSIRNSNKADEDFKAENVNGKFLILDGIDYKNPQAEHRLVYMEV